jgi:hypothetical protein
VGFFISSSDVLSGGLLQGSIPSQGEIELVRLIWKFQACQFHATDNAHLDAMAYYCVAAFSDKGIFEHIRGITQQGTATPACMPNFRTFGTSGVFG